MNPTYRDGTGGYKLNKYKDTGFSKCSCSAGFRPGILLDPFSGAGTALVVAKKLGRHYIGIDCVKDYLNMSRKRLVKITAVERELF